MTIQNSSDLTACVDVKLSERECFLEGEGVEPPKKVGRATMGLTISSLLQQYFGNQKVRILMVGLDAAGMQWRVHSVQLLTLLGKTTILYRLKLGEVVTTIPTLGFNVETVKYNNISFTVWGKSLQPNLALAHFFQT